MLPLRGHHWVTLLWICLVLDTVAAVRLPGVAWSKLELWEGSALADVWLRSAEYLEFRTYALSCLSDLGFLDHLINDFNPTLRVLGGVGAATGMLCAIATGRSSRSSTSTSLDSQQVSVTQ